MREGTILTVRAAPKTVKLEKKRVGTQRRQEIACVAEVLFADRGIHATTVRDIGDRVGMRSRSLYHHFKTKHDIVHELMRGRGTEAG